MLLKSSNNHNTYIYKLVFSILLDLWLLNSVYLFVNVVWLHLYILFRGACSWKGQLEKSRNWKVLSWKVRAEVAKFASKLESSGRSWTEVGKPLKKLESFK